jgi:hypothetical protein
MFLLINGWRMVELTQFMFLVDVIIRFLVNGRGRIVMLGVFGISGGLGMMFDK